MTANTVFWMCVSGIEFMLILLLSAIAANRIREAEERADHFEGLYEHELELRQNKLRGRD